MKARGALERAASKDESSEVLMLLGRTLLLSDQDAQAERVLQRAAINCRRSARVLLPGLSGGTLRSPGHRPPRAGRLPRARG